MYYPACKLISFFETICNRSWGCQFFEIQYKSNTIKPNIFAAFPTKLQNILKESENINQGKFVIRYLLLFAFCYSLLLYFPLRKSRIFVQKNYSIKKDSRRSTTLLAIIWQANCNSFSWHTPKKKNKINKLQILQVSYHNKSIKEYLSRQQI